MRLYEPPQSAWKFRECDEPVLEVPAYLLPRLSLLGNSGSAMMRKIVAGVARNTASVCLEIQGVRFRTIAADARLSEPPQSAWKFRECDSAATTGPQSFPSRLSLLGNSGSAILKTDLNRTSITKL